MSEYVKYELEFLINSSINVLYNLISTPSGMSKWFADDVNVKDDIYTFIWEGSEEKAKMISKKKKSFVKYKWLEHDEDEETYFELFISIDDLTNEVALIITDFAEEDEVEEAQLLWENQINELTHVLGG